MPHQAYVFDPDDPRAPTESEWNAFDAAARERIVAQLPSEFPTETAPEGDRHRLPKERASQALSEFFRRAGRRVYVSAELPIYYPGERWFAPDLIAVIDVEPSPRDKWVVSAEGKGLDLVIEVTLRGNRSKDLENNVERYSRLAIPEYFVVDLLRSRLIGYRLDTTTGSYMPILPQGGRWASHVLGLDLVMEGGRVRFYLGTAPLLEAEELVSRLTSMVDELVAKEEELAEALEREQAKVISAEHRADSAEARAARLSARLRELGVDPDA